MGWAHRKTTARAEYPFKPARQVDGLQRNFWNLIRVGTKLKPQDMWMTNYGQQMELKFLAR